MRAAVATLVLVASTQASGAVRGRGPQLPAAQDLAGIRERTRWLDSLAVRHPPAARHREPAAEPSLERLGQLVDGKHGFSRLAFPRALAPEQVREASVAIDDTVVSMRVHGARMERLLAGQIAALAAAKVAPSRVARLRRELEQLQQVVAEVIRIGSRASVEVTEQSRWDRYVAQLLGNSVADSVRKLRLLAAVPSESGAAILGAELNYVHGSLRATPLPQGNIQPAYMGGASGLKLEDTTAGSEIELPPELVAQAHTLGSALEARRFVQQQCRLDWYYGSLKGSAETLRSRRGNDADLAALLIALLRAQGTPARYVRGTIVLPVARLATLAGLATQADLDALASTGTVPDELRTRTLSILSAAGVPFEPVISGGVIASVRLMHVWVEAFVAYADYRGTAATPSGKQWIALDPSIPGDAKSIAVAPTVDAWAAAGLSSAQLSAEFLGSSAGLSPLELTQTRIQDYLRTAHPDLSYADVLRSVKAVPEQLPFLPSTLPYEVATVLDEPVVLPDGFKHRVRFLAQDGGGPLLDITLPAHQLVAHRTTFAYVPASDEDAFVIAASGGLLQAPPSGVELLPIVTVDGVTRATATRSVGLGATHLWRTELLLPDGTSRRIDNQTVAGNLVAVGVSAPRNDFVEPVPQPDGDLDGGAARFLYGRASAYANAWTDAEEEFARLLGVVPLWPTASIVFVENQLSVQEALGFREAVIWNGLQVDADLRTTATIELVPGRSSELQRMAGLQGSFEEAKVLSDGLGVPAISATGVLQQAQAQNVPVLELTPANAATLLPQLSTQSGVLEDVRDQLALGRSVRIPTADLGVSDWKGTGYIVEDPASGNAGYFLSGGISGGQTVLSPGKWSIDKQLEADLRAFDVRKVVDGAAEPQRIARILKVQSTDLQTQTVDTATSKALIVYVTTLDGIPVKNANVTFAATGLSQPQLARTLPGDPPPPSDSPTWTGQVSTTTDQYGRAYVFAKPDKVVAHQAVERKLQSTDASVSLLGLNLITAATASDAGITVQLGEPFVLLGKPDVPASVDIAGLSAFPVNAAGQVVQAAGVASQSNIIAVVQDKNGNAIANETVTWTQTPGTGGFLDPATATLTHTPFLGEDPKQVASLVQSTDRFGRVAMRYIPGLAAGLYDVQAAATHGSPPTVEFTVAAVQVDTLLTVSLLPGFEGKSLDGIPHMAFPTPFLVRAYSRSASGYALMPLSDSPQQGSATIAAELRRLQTGGDSVLISTLSPKPTAFSPIGPLGDATTAVFWPEYPITVGAQDVDAIVFKCTTLDGSGKELDCNANTAPIFYFRDTEPMIQTRRINSLGRVQPPDACPVASLADSGIQFDIVNASWGPIYARLTAVASSAATPLVKVADDQQLVPRYPDDPTLILLDVGTTHLPANLVQGVGTGKFAISLWSLDPRLAPSPGLPPPVNDLGVQKVVPVLDAGASLGTGDPLHALVTVPVLNFTTAANPRAVQTNPADLPFSTPADMRVCPTDTGTVTVTVTDPGAAALSTVLSMAELQRDTSGNYTLTPIPHDPPWPMPAITPEGELRVLIPPGNPGPDPQTVSVTIDTHQTGASGLPLVRNSSRPLYTDIDVGAVAPIGHTLVKDVDVATGYLIKQSEDLRVAGRGVGFSLVRSYTNRSRARDTSPMGDGWTHSYRSWAMETPLGADSMHRFMIYGGDGNGYSFACDVNSVCTAQSGVHASLTIGLPSDRVLLRTRTGVTYRFGPPIAGTLPMQRLLEAIVDGTGHEVTLEYGTADTFGELKRVWDPDNQRFLEFTYDKPQGARHPRLVRVALLDNDKAPKRLALTDPAPNIGPDGICLVYDYDDNQMLTSAARHRGSCSDALARNEQYSYVASSDPILWNNLETYTDPNGNVTSFQYYANDAQLPGENQNPMVFFGDKQERVRAVREPTLSRLGKTPLTQFVYALGPPPEGQNFGYQFYTDVFGPRADVTLATRYWMNPYGSAGRIERPVDANGNKAVTVMDWDPVTILKTSETDPLGRKTTFAYDDKGNMIRRSTATPASFDSTGVQMTVPPRDAQGNSISSVVEKWAYDPSFSRETCHVDPEGGVTLTSVDATTGLTLGTSRKAGFADQAALLDDTTSCADVANTVSSASGDVATAQQYCGVNVDSDCPAAFETGDLRTSTDGAGHLTTVEMVDALGNGTVLEKAGPDHSIDVHRSYDRLGRLLDESDSLGHHTIYTYDGLDHIATKTRANSKGAAQPATFAYWPTGQLRVETNGIAGFQRTYKLDELNRVSEIDEQLGGSAGTLVTSSVHDEQGNVVRSVDRRGVATDTLFDWLDHPYQRSTQVDAASTAAYFGDGITYGGANDAQVYVTTATYDPAGNKIAETDRHGFRTEYTLDSLYRVVMTRHAAVPDVDSASPRDPTRVWSEQTSWDRVGRKLAQTDGNGHTSTQAYDGLGRVRLITDAKGRRTHREYDGLGGLTHEWKESGGPNIVERLLTYDFLERPVAVTEKFQSRSGTGTYTRMTAYDDAAHIGVSQDGRGYLTTRVYDDLDQIVSETVDDVSNPTLGLFRPADAAPALHLSTAYEYDGNGNRTIVHAPLGRDTVENFDGLNRRVSRQLPLGVSESWRYDGESHVVKSVDRRKVEHRTMFDAVGRPVQDGLVGGDGSYVRLMSRGYADVPANGLVKVSDYPAARGQTDHLFDALGREVQTVDPIGAVTDTYYDATVRRAVRDPRNYVTKFHTDEIDRIDGQTEFAPSSLDRTTDGALVYSQGTDYDDGQTDGIVRVTSHDRRNIPSLREEDGLGRVEHTVRGSGSATHEEQFAYDANGNQTQHVLTGALDASPSVKKWAYDGANRKTLETRAPGTSVESDVSFSWDDAGRQIEKTNEETGTFEVRNSYDDLDRLVRAEQPGGLVTTTAYDEAGNKICEKRPLDGDPLQGLSLNGVDVRALVCAGVFQQHEYDAQQNLRHVKDFGGFDTWFAYDDARDVVSQTDANGHITTYDYDTRGLRVAEHRGAFTWNWTYDLVGNRATFFDPEQRLTSYSYGILNRITREEYDVASADSRPLPTLLSIDRGYDENGNLNDVRETKRTSAGDIVEETTRLFDGLDRLQTETRPDTKQVAYAYDAHSNRQSVTDPDGNATTYTYDAQDRLQTVTAEGQTSTYALYRDNLQHTLTLGNGIVEERAYDAARRLTSITTPLSRFTYQYDANGNRTQQVETRTDPATQIQRPPETTTYGYDALDRLTGVSYGDGRFVLYKLDPVGNRIGERETRTAAPLGPDGFPQGTALTRDVTAQFDEQDWLLSRSDAVDPTRNVTFSYDRNGNLVRKQTATTTRDLRWDARNTLTVVVENGMELGRYDYRWDGLRVKRAAQGQQVAYVLDDKFVLGELNGSGSTTRRYHYGTQPLAESEVSGASRFTTWLSVDAQASVTDATQSDGTVRTARQYDAWGNYRGSTAPGSADPKLGYTGHQFDPETGLTYARARYYDADLGIFLSRDPKEPAIGEAPWLQRYAYVKDNPLRYVDIDGEWEAPFEWADRWQRERHRVGLPTGEEVAARYAADVEQRAVDMFDQDFHEGASGPVRTTASVLHATATSTLLESTVGYLSAAATDPGMVLRSILRLGTGSASGVEDIRRGEVLLGTSKIFGEVSTAVLVTAGAKGAAARLPDVKIEWGDLTTTVPDELGGLARQEPAFYSGAPIRVQRKGGIGPVLKGQEGEALSEAEAIAAGEKIRGRQVTLELPSRRRTRPDLLTEPSPDSLKIREAKNGRTAELTPGQQELKETIEQGGTVIPRGKNAKEAGLTPGQPVTIKSFEEDRF